MRTTTAAKTGTTGVETMTEGTTEIAPADVAAAVTPPREHTDAAGGSWFGGVRLRILGGYIALLALATLASVVIARQIVLARLDERIGEELVQETQELRRLAGGTDPATGRAFGPDVRRIFRVFLERNIPARHETFLTFVNGQSFLRSSPVLDRSYRIDRDETLTAQWSRVRTSDRGSLDTPAGRLEYLAVPLRTGGDQAGVFVVAQLRDPEERELEIAIFAIAGVGAVVLLIGSIMAWRLAGSLLRPVRAVTETARSLSESDLSRRIPVEGTDEVGLLAATFNAMLDRLEHAFATQRRFLDDAGHELRTPITIVRGHLELLEEEPEQRRETLALVMDELDRMSRMVNELLELAKAEEPDFLAPEPVELGPLTKELHAKASALPGTWLLEGSGDGVIVADRQRLTQALMQLAENAVQHAGSEQPIGIGSALANDQARIWVRDRGPGIDPEEQQHLFDRFSRGRSGDSDGAGLGLAIVKAIAEGHGGRVEVDSRRGAGATFTIVLPGQPRSERK
jgi:two-component system, OmpR family, sensor kinase